MQNARYYRDKAALCLEIAEYISDPNAVEILRESAAQYFARADKLEKRTPAADAATPDRREG